MSTTGNEYLSVETGKSADTINSDFSGNRTKDKYLFQYVVAFTGKIFVRVFHKIKQLISKFRYSCYISIWNISVICMDFNIPACITGRTFTNSNHTSRRIMVSVYAIFYSNRWSNSGSFFDG